MTALHVPDGDFRQRDAVEAWAREIAEPARTAEARGARREIAVG